MSVCPSENLTSFRTLRCAGVVIGGEILSIVLEMPATRLDGRKSPHGCLDERLTQKFRGDVWGVALEKTGVQ
jgi:hypothetical protein